MAPEEDATVAPPEGQGRSLSAPAPGGPRLRGRFAWPAIVVCSCVLAAFAATWPLATRLTTAIPLGTEEPATVGVFSIWTLWWTADRLAHGFAHYWDAPFFYPNPGVFTYSEPEPLTGLAVAPLWALGAPPALIHNLALLAILVLNGVLAYRVARAVALPRAPGLVAGLLTVTLPFAAKEYGVLNLTPVFGILWTLDGLIRFARTGAGRHAAWAAAGFLSAYLTCQQYALLFAPFAVIAGLVALGAQGFRLLPVGRLAVATLGVGLGLLFVAWPALTLHQELGLARDPSVVQALSARPVDFLSRPGTAWLPVPPPDFADTAGLYPGLILLGLATAGAAFGWQARGSRRWSGYFLALAMGALLLALGLNLDLVGWQPFAMVRALVPGFAELRSPYRFAMIFQVALPILAGLGLAALGARVGRGAGRVLLGIGVLGALENLTTPVPLVSVPLSARTAWTAWLHAQPAGTVVAHIPFPAGLRVADYEVEAWRLFAQIDHGRPLVNGYSGYFPPGYTPFQVDMARQFPERGLLCQLAKGLSVDTLVVDQSWLAGHQAQMAAQTGFLRQVYTDSQVAIYHLHAEDAGCPANPSPP